MNAKIYTQIKTLLKKTKKSSEKGLFWIITGLLLAVIIVYLFYEENNILLSKEKIDVISKLFLLLLQFIGLLLIIFFVMIILRSLLSKQDGTLIFPFDVPIDDKTYNGKAIVDAFIAERYRLLHIDIYEEKNESAQEPESGINKTEDKDIKNISKEQQKVKSKNLDSQISKVPLKDIETPIQNIYPYLTNISVKVGETTFSLNQVLFDIKRLWNDKKPQYIITGSLQKYSSGLKLIVRKDGEMMEAWEATSENSDNGDLLEIIKEITLKMVNAELKFMNSPDNYKLYIAANEKYRQYLQTNDIEELQGACKNVIDALNADSGIKNSPQLLEKLYIACYQNKNYELAYQICNWIIELGNNFEKSRLSEIHIHLGICCEELQKFQEAALAYRTAMKSDEENLFSYYYLTLLYSKFRDLEGLKKLDLGVEFQNSKIIKIINEATKVNPVDSYTLGEWYKDLNLIPQAKTEYLKALKQESDNIGLHYSIGNTLQDLGENNMAIELLTKAVELGRQNKDDATYLANIYNDLAFAYSKRENSTYETIDLYKKAIAEDHLLSISYSNLGIIYESMGEFDDAVDFYNTAYKIDPYSIDFAIQLASIYNRFDYNKEAIDIIKTLVEKSPQLHSILASFYCDNGEFEKAIEECEAAINFDAESPYNYRDLGYIYVGKNLINRALDEFEKSLQLESNFRYTHAAKAGCFKRLDRIDEYQNEVNLAMQLEMEPGENEYNQASFEALCGRTNEAVKLLEIVLQKRLHTPIYISRDWDFDFVKDDPNFKKLINKD